MLFAIPSEELYQVPAIAYKCSGKRVVSERFMEEAPAAVLQNQHTVGCHFFRIIDV